MDVYMDGPPDPVDIIFNYTDPEDYVRFSDFALASPIFNVVLVWGKRALDNAARCPLLNAAAMGVLARFRRAPHCRLVVFDNGVAEPVFGGTLTLVYNVAHVLGKLPPGIVVDPRRLALIFARKRAAYARDRRGETIDSRVLVLNAPFHVTQDIASLGGGERVFYVQTGDDMAPLFPLLVGSARFPFERFGEVLGEFVATTESTICPGCLLRDVSAENRHSILCYEEAEEDAFKRAVPSDLAMDAGHWCCDACYQARVYPERAPHETTCYCPSPRHRGRAALIYAGPREHETQ